MPRKKPVRVCDLTPSLCDGSPEPHFLLCLVCGARCTANASDYFMWAPDDVIQHCDEPMRLAVRKPDFELVQ